MRAKDSAIVTPEVALLPEAEVGGEDWASRLISRRSMTVASSVIRDLLAVTQRSDIISLAGGLPDDTAMPHLWLRSVLDDVLSTARALQYSATDGDPRLRALLADWETRWTGREIDAGDVLVTTGSQQALDLIGKALLDPGDEVVVEDPAYVGALQSFQLAGARLSAVPQDEAGMRTDVLEGLLSAGLRPKLVYLTPTFHNPAGTCLTPARRSHVASLAEQFGFLVVEDDAYRRLSFGSDPPAPIARDTDRIVRLGTFSKILSPGLRVGWLTAPAKIMSAMVRTKQATDLHTSTLAQAMLVHVAADERRLAAHVAQLRELYARRATHLITALRAEFGGRIAINSPAGGMFCWACFTDGTDTTKLLPISLAHGVAFVPGPAFSPSGHSAARFCFASVGETLLSEAVRRVAAAHAQLRDDTGPRQ